MTQFFVGTSGYSYKEWKGSFYPEKLPAGEMLSFYAEHFSTVELNGTHYRMPQVSDAESWAAEVPAKFRFVMKAPQTITHRKRLKDVEEPTEQFLQAAEALGKKRGPLFVQLPPNFKKDLEKLTNFLTLVDGRAELAFEFRHASWLDDDTTKLLRKWKCALCVNDEEKVPRADVVKTATWAYLRLRRERYTDGELKKWIDATRVVGFKKAYVFFKHEDTGSGSPLAKRFVKLTIG